MSPKARKIIGWVLTVLIVGFLCFSALGKLVPGLGMDEAKAAEMKAMMTSFGFTLEELKLVGILEIFCALMFLIPRTGVLGTLLVTAYLGGAIATHLEHAAARPGTITPVILEAVVWITALIRFPELGHRLFGNGQR